MNALRATDDIRTFSHILENRKENTRLAKIILVATAALGSSSHWRTVVEIVELLAFNFPYASC
jgi:hypothetical protein